MNYDRIEHIDSQKAERYRLSAYAFFFLCLAALLLGVVPAMYYGNGWWVLTSLILAGVFFFLAFFTGGVGWSRLDMRDEAPRQSVYRAESSRAETVAEEEPPIPVTPPDESAGPYSPPAPTDQSRPPFE